MSESIGTVDRETLGREADDLALRPRGSVGYLPGDPLGSRVGSDADCDEPSAGVMQND